MFQCKDLLSLTTMSQADVIAGSGGMEKGIRWSYKAENINFPLFTMPWNVPLLDFFEELGHAISYLDDRKDIEDSSCRDYFWKLYQYIQYRTKMQANGK